MEINPSSQPGNWPIWLIIDPVYYSDLTMVPRVERFPEYHDSEESVLHALGNMASGTACYRQSYYSEDVVIARKTASSGVAI